MHERYNFKMIQLISKQAGRAAEVSTWHEAGIKSIPSRLIMVTNPNKTELDFLGEKFQLKRGNLDDALDLNESPRLDHDKSYGYLYVRWPHVHRDGSTTTRPMLLIYNVERVIVISPIKPDSLDYILGSDSDLSTESSPSILLELLSQVTNDFEVNVKGQSEIIKRIITKMRSRRLENEDFIGFIMIEEQINNFMSALTPIVPLLRRVSTSKYLTFSDDQRDLLDDITLSAEQSIHISDSNKSRIVSIREAYATLSNNSLNRTMKALTAATMFIALPNVVFGMYGMNIDLPLQHEQWAFLAILLGTISAITIIIIVARKRHWF